MIFVLGSADAEYQLLPCSKVVLKRLLLLPVLGGNGETTGSLHVERERGRENANSFPKVISALQSPTALCLLLKILTLGHLFWLPSNSI